MDKDGEHVSYPWQPLTWYGVRDDRPHLDILVQGHPAQSADKTKLEKLEDVSPEGWIWQRWNFEAEIARDRRFGEISLPLKVPEGCILRCYINPTALLGYREVVTMIEDIESELGVDVTWDVTGQRLDRSWSRFSNGGGHRFVQEIIRSCEEELLAARAIRRTPFSELGPRFKRDCPLPENAVVSHWAMKRHQILHQAHVRLEEALSTLKGRSTRNNPSGRLPDLLKSIERLEKLGLQLVNLKGVLSRLCRNEELQTLIHPSPLFLRDIRLRHLLRAFAPRRSETISIIESDRSFYPPIFLNRLWELWGAVWLAKMFRRMGFNGECLLNPVDQLHSCSWKLRRDDVVVELDYEAHPTFIDYMHVPPVHERGMPVLEWAALNQTCEPDRPYLGAEEKSSPDYLVRLTTPAGRFLLVGDACLASPLHHAVRKPQDAKPYTVEHYRQNLAWVAEGQAVRCHSLGGFVIYPPPTESWTHLEQIPGVRDCTLISPHPQGDEQSCNRLFGLLASVAPDVPWVN